MSKYELRQQHDEMDVKSFVWNGYNLIIIVNVIYGGDPPCPANIKTCYNCEVVPGCLENEYNNLSEQECLDKLTSQLIIWSVEYVHASGYCRESKCEDIEIQYKEGSVIHRKTCDSSYCADYTLTLTNSSAVSSSETEFYNDLGPKVRECLSYCLSTSAACTISYETSQEECTVYTECLDNCGIISAPSTWSIYTKSCGNNLTGTSSTTTTETTTQPPTTTTETTTQPPTTTTETTTQPPTTTTETTTQPPTTTTETTTTTPPPTTTTETTTPPTTTTETMTTTTPPTTTTVTTTPPPTTTSVTTTAPSQSTTTLSPIATSASSTLPGLYILPCICYNNKTFVNLSEEEIIRLLINHIKIDTKATYLAQSKLKSSQDSRTSSKVIGITGIVILCVSVSLILCLDLFPVSKKMGKPL